MVSTLNMMHLQDLTDTFFHNGSKKMNELILLLQTMLTCMFFFIFLRPVIFLLFCGYYVYTLKYSRTYDSKQVNEKEKVEKDQNYICLLT